MIPLNRTCRGRLCCEGNVVLAWCAFGSNEPHLWIRRESSTEEFRALIYGDLELRQGGNCWGGGEFGGILHLHLYRLYVLNV